MLISIFLFLAWSICVAYRIPVLIKYPSHSHHLKPVIIGCIITINNQHEGVSL